MADRHAAGARRRPAGRRHLWADVRRARHHLRRHAGGELRARRLHDAGHVRRLLSGDRLRRARVPRPLCRPDRRRRARRADRVRGRLAAAPLPDRAGHRRARGDGRGGRPLRPDHPHARHRAGARQRRAHPVRLAAGVGADAAVAPVVGGRRDPAQPGAHRRLRPRHPVHRSALSFPGAHHARQGAARRRRQPDRGRLCRRRRRPLSPLRLRARRRHHRGGGRPDRQHAVVPALYRLRLRHRHVCRRRAGRARQHPRRVLGRADHRRRAADVDARSCPISCRTPRSSSCSC